MFILIVGGGKVGRYLIKEFSNKDYKVVLIEQDYDKAVKIEEKYDIEVICGDGSEQDVLEKAGIEECDILLAVTEDDQDNLVICQLAERKYNISRTFTTVNTPGNEKLFNWLGVNVAVSSASILAGLVEYDVTLSDLNVLLKKDQDQLRLTRVLVRENSSIVGQKVKDIELPLESVLVTILRGDNTIVPRGNTKIMGNDLILVLTKKELSGELVKIFNK
ncbi:TrkA family potassium uptake protein [Iocasia frigidifontis]|uniref:Trk system potassium uptake protein TrkA n=1 Tax=Iocasia fonsfrigidae TaxID=2682810 RepID=A0A8A7KF14_9FIRM|nr:NAD-binding protein [Iocasia fonsfrigidae]QTL99860.1 TrkA family potassium uptake protein [Iocasia fonsfrigidae]